jgi:hypothetical protein
MVGVPALRWVDELSAEQAQTNQKAQNRKNRGEMGWVGMGSTLLRNAFGAAPPWAMAAKANFFEA